MKIGVITYFSIVNYGAALQAASLNRFLRSEGHEADVIDYQPRRLQWYQFKGEIQQILKYHFGWYNSVARRRSRIVSSYVRRIGAVGDKRCVTHNDLVRLARNYDVLITGSDEIWNLGNFLKWDTAFLLDFGRPISVPRLSYAASASSFKPTQAQLVAMRRSLGPFSHIFVRDEATADLVRSMGLEAERVLDPVFIGDLPTKPFGFPEPYLMMAGNMTPEQRVTAVKIARCYGLKAIGVGYEYPEADACRAAVDPSEWMGAVKGAACIVSTLFHASAFALKFDRPFFIFRTSGKVEKTRGLLELTGSDSRMISPGFMPPNDRPENLAPAVCENVYAQTELSRAKLRTALESLRQVPQAGTKLGESI